MKRLKKITKIFILVALLISIATYLMATHVLPYAVLQPQRQMIDVKPQTISKNYIPVAIPFAQNDSLRGYLFNPVIEEPKAVLILVHGIGGAKEHFFPLAANLTKQGYSAIVLDNRAHGESDGAYTTYGFKEKKDISLVVDYLKQNLPDVKVGIWGSSMGGAVALQAMAQDNRIAFGIVESTFTNLSQIVYDYQKRYSGGIGLRFLTDYVLGQAGKIAQFDPKQVSPENAAKNIKNPVFLAHGDKDARITYTYSEQLYENLATQDKTIEIVKGAGHLNLGEIGGEEYYNKVLLFISRQLGQ